MSFQKVSMKKLFEPCTDRLQQVCKPKDLLIDGPSRCRLFGSESARRAVIFPHSRVSRPRTLWSARSNNPRSFSKDYAYYNFVKSCCIQYK